MDSHFNYTHWIDSSHPILADEWIGDEKLEEFIELPGGIDLPEDLEFSMESITKFPLKDAKKQKKKNPDQANAGPGIGGAVNG
jgi:hypothetical protein